MRATDAEIAEMKRRLEKRREQRQFDADADEVIRMVQHREKRPPAETPEREAMEKREYVGRMIPAAQAFSFGAAAVICARAVSSNWLFLLALGMAVFAAAAVM